MAVSSVSYAGAYSSSINIGTTIKELEKQMTLLQKIINQIQDDDDLDENVRNNQISEYQKQIQILQTKIQQLNQSKSEQTSDSQSEKRSSSYLFQNKDIKMMGIGHIVDEMI